jgi:hypothetical protein
MRCAPLSSGSSSQSDRLSARVRTKPNALCRGLVGTVLAGASQGGENCRAQPRHENEVVEMAGLQCGVLPVIGKAEKLAAIRLDRRSARTIHPSNDR